MIPGPTPVATADFDGDGLPDLVESQGFLHGQGDGTFTAGASLGLPSPPLAILSADFDADGRADLATNDGVLLGRGDGTFGDPLSLAVSSGCCSSPTPTGIGDFDGDGKLDLVIDDSRLLLGNGDGTFRDAAEFGGLLPTGSVEADVNRDGKLDVAVVGANGASAYVQPVLGNGDGTFRTPLSTSLVASGLEQTAMSSGDFNGDGAIDLVIASFAPPGGAELALLLGSRDGTFDGSLAMSVSGEERVGAMGTGDVDGDGKVDVVAAGVTSLMVFLGDGEGHLRTGSRYGGVTPSSAIALGDLDGDGHLDVVVSNDPGAGMPPGIALFLGRGDGTFASPTYAATGVLAPSDLLIADFNADGKLDVGTTLGVLLGQGSGSLAPLVPFAGSPKIDSLRSGDLNGDGRLDLLGIGPDALSVLLGHGDGSFAAPTSYGSFGPESTAAAAVADFNRDGKVDVIVDGAPLLLFLGAGDGTFGQAQPVDPGGFFALLAGDFNQDGKMDLAGGAYIDGVSVFLNESPCAQ